MLAGNATATGWIAFDAVEIDCAGRRLFVAGSETPLEPKAFAVLHLLASHPGKAFTRNEILDAVWSHRHVTPSVLNRVATLIRQALGESADEHRCLHTLYGVGYRFDAPVRFSAQRAPAEPDAPVPETAEPARDDVARVARALFLPAGSTAPPAANDSTPALPRVEPDLAPVNASLPPDTAPPPTHRMRRWLLPAAALVLLALAIAWWWPHTAASPSASAAATVATVPTLVVLPLRPIGTEPGETVLAEGLSEEVTTRLARIAGLRMISSTSAALAQSGKFDLPQLAEKLKVTHALEGSLREDGDQLRIDLRLLEVPGGKTIWAQDYDRPLADVFAIQRDIAQAVAGALTLRLGLAAAPSSAGDVDVALYRQYLELRGVLLKQEFTPGLPKQTAARAALRELIAGAPGYARAHGLLAHSLVLWFSPNEQERAEVEREATRALQLDHDDSDAHFALAELACRRMDWEVCLAEHRRALDLDPTDVTARGDYAFRLIGLGYLDAALAEFETAYRSDPLFAPVGMSRARLLDTLGRHDEAKNALDTLIKLDAGMPQRASYARWHNAIWRHDYAQAQEFTAQMPEQEGFRESYAAVTLALQDAALWPQALKTIQESERRTGRYNVSRLLGPNYDAQAVFANFETMLSAGFPTFFMLVWQPEYAALRGDPAFQDYIRRTHILDYWRAHGFPPQCKPKDDGARCD